MDTSLGKLSLMLNTDHYVVITHDQRHCEFYVCLHFIVVSLCEFLIQLLCLSIATVVLQCYRQ